MIDYFDSLWPDESIQGFVSGVLPDEAILSSGRLGAVATWSGVLQQLRSFTAGWRAPAGYARPAPQVISDALEFLAQFRQRFPEHPPVRAAVGPDGEVLIEWQWDRGQEYAEVELTGPNELEAMYVPRAGRARHNKIHLRLPGDEPHNVVFPTFALARQHDSALTAMGATVPG